MIEHIENPKALTALFGEGFDIFDVNLHEVVVHRDGPSLRLRFDIPQVPRSTPSRWPTGANTTQVVLQAGSIEELQIAGFSNECRGSLQSLTNQGGKLLEFNGSGCSLKCKFASLRVESVTGYINA